MEQEYAVYPWESEAEFATVMGFYLLDEVKNFIKQNGEEALDLSQQEIDKLDLIKSPGLQESIDDLTLMDYLADWIKRNEIPINLREIVDAGEKKFSELKDKYDSKIRLE